MSFNFEDHYSNEFTINAKNAQLKYPKFPIVQLCPLWRDQILNENELDLTDINDSNGIRDFFESFNKKEANFTVSNCYTILKLSKKAGFTEYADEVNKYIINKIGSIQSILNDLIQSNPNNNQHENEIFLSHNYNHILQFPDLLQELDISSHLRILQTALRYDQNTFNFHDFINFVIQVLEKTNNRRYSVLLSLFSIDKFDIDDLDRLFKCKHFDISFIKDEAQSFISIIKECQEKIKQLEIKYDQSQSQINKLTKNTEYLVKNCSFTPTFMKTQKLLVPINQEWKLNGPREASLSSVSNPIIVKSSPTYNNLDSVNPCYLFTHGGWDCWGAHREHFENSFILIEFTSPVVANFLTITSRKQCFNETPQIIQIFAKNNNSDFALLARFEGISCGNYQTKYFKFDNSLSYSVYKIMFNMPNLNANTISLDKLNLGELTIPFS